MVRKFAKPVMPIKPPRYTAGAKPGVKKPANVPKRATGNIVDLDFHVSILEANVAANVVIKFEADTPSTEIRFNRTKP